MTSRKALGRGLDALIPQSRPPSPPATVPQDVTSDVNRIHMIHIDTIVPNPRQPRSEMSDTGLEEMALSIRDRGVLEPLIVRPLEDRSYELVAGERRLRASKRAGRTTVPVLFRDLGDRASLEIALIENLQREDLNPVDEARAYHQLIDEFGRTHAEISKAVGKDRSTVSNLLRLLKLPPEILIRVSRGTLSAGHGRMLLNVEDPEQQLAMADQMVAEGWSVREAERRIGEIRGSSPEGSGTGGKTKKRSATQAERDPEVVRVEEAIRNVLGTEVRLIHGAGGGKIEIHYFSDEELERILELINVEVY